jgi:hypothetical protein
MRPILDARCSLCRGAHLGLQRRSAYIMRVIAILFLILTLLAVLALLAVLLFNFIPLPGSGDGGSVPALPSGAHILELRRCAIESC